MNKAFVFVADSSVQSSHGPLYDLDPLLVRLVLCMNWAKIAIILVITENIIDTLLLYKTPYYSDTVGTINKLIESREKFASTT